MKVFIGSSFLLIVCIGIALAKEPEWTVSATRSEKDEKLGTLTFNENVVAKKVDLEMSCDKLVIHINETEEFKTFVATGATVTIKRFGEKGKLQLAKARKAEFDDKDRSITLTGGPPYFQNGDQYINTDSEDAKIILMKDGKYTVSSPTKGPRRIVIPPK